MELLLGLEISSGLSSKSGGGNKGGSLLLTNNSVASLNGSNVLNGTLDLSGKTGGGGELTNTSGNDLLQNLRVLNLGDLRGLNDASSVDLVLLNDLALTVDGAGDLLNSLTGNLDHTGHLLDNLTRNLNQTRLLDHLSLGNNAGDLNDALNGLQKVARLLDDLLLLDNALGVDNLVVESLASMLLNNGVRLHDSAGNQDTVGVNNLMRLVDNVGHVLVNSARLVNNVLNSVHNSVLSRDHLRNVDNVSLGNKSALNLNTVLSIGVLSREASKLLLGSELGVGNLGAHY